MWYRTRAKRLELEIKQMQKGAPQFSLWHDTDTGRLMWRGSVCVRGHSHEVRLVYSKNHPYEKMTVYVKPKLTRSSLHIHSDGSLCYMGGSEWNAQWTAFSVLLVVIRFLDDYYSGRMY
jgi:ubiquitin-protein ligase